MFKTIFILLSFDIMVLAQAYQSIIPRYVDIDVQEPDPRLRDGLTWQTAWKDFSEFNINDRTKVPDNSIINVAPGIYNTHSYNVGGESALIWINDKNNITI